MILDKQVRTLLYTFTTREKMDKWIIIDPVLPPPRMNNPRYDRRRIFSHRRDRFSSKTLSKLVPVPCKPASYKLMRYK